MTIQIVAGDNRSIIAEVTTSDGTAVALTGATVTLAIKNSAGTVYTATGTVSSEITNEVSFDLPATVYDVAGEYKLQLKVELDGDIRILPSDGNYGHLKVTTSLFG